MDLTPIQPGDLMAYLDGVQLPHVEQALQVSAELRQELEDLRQTERRFQAVFADLALADPQDLVDVATGQASAEQQLRVAAYVRVNPQGRQDLADLITAATPAPRLRLPRFIALPQVLATSLRALEPVAPEQSFYATELAAQVVVRILPPKDDRWRIEGFVTRNEQPVAQARISLRAEHARPRPRHTDADGFFTFARLQAGVYQLQVRFDDGMLFLPSILLNHD